MVQPKTVKGPNELNTGFYVNGQGKLKADERLVLKTTKGWQRNNG